MMASPRIKDELADEMERHTWRLCPAGIIGTSLLTTATTATYASNTDTETVFSTWDCSSNSTCAYYLCADAEAEMLRQEALAMKQRDLGYLYQPLLPRLRVVLRRSPRIIFQPCWSKRRWKSLT